MTAAYTTERGASMPIVQVVYSPDEWVPDAPYKVRHTEYGLYMSFRNVEYAITYAKAVAAMMDLDWEVVE